MKQYIQPKSVIFEMSTEGNILAGSNRGQLNLNEEYADEALSRKKDIWNSDNWLQD